MTLLAFAACSSDGTSVSAEGDPTAIRVDATTTNEATIMQPPQPPAISTVSALSVAFGVFR